MAPTAFAPSAAFQSPSPAEAHGDSGNGLPGWAAGLAPQLLAGARAGLLLLDGRDVLYANPMAARILGRSPGALVGVPVASLIAPTHRKAVLQQMELRLAGEPGGPRDIRCVRGKGREFDARVWGQALTLAGRRVNLVTISDVSELKDAMRRIEELANFDEITGLPNRANLLLQLDGAVERARLLGLSFSLLSIDVPRITELASTMGFGAADTLAMAVAARLRAHAATGELIAHLGGGEFALMRWHDGVDSDAELDDAADGGIETELDSTDATATVSPPRIAASATPAERAALLCDALMQPVNFGGTDISAQGRIGIALYPDDADCAAALLEAAQTARRDTGPSEAVAAFKLQAREQARQALLLEAALREALARNELALAYQPQVSLTSGAVIGVEALLRWRSAEFGAVPPDVFIPVAERTGLIAAIGDWVIHEACAQIVRWQALGLPALRVHVNISAVQFQLGDVAAAIQRALQATGASPLALGVELTESALLHDGDRVAETLRRLHDMGIEVALDDFGTGFSSLSRLRSLPIDLLKIDRSFVSDVTAAPDSASLTRSIINLAHGLRIPVLAEGVETEGQMKMLVANGCDSMQGYLFSRPVPADEVTAMLRAGRNLSGLLAARAPHTRTLMLVGEDSAVLAALQRVFTRADCTIVCAASGEQALNLLATSEVGVILADQHLSGISGVDFLRRVQALHPEAMRITLSAPSDLQTLVDAVNEGAVHQFLLEPWNDRRLREHVSRAFDQKEMADDKRRLQREVAAANAELATLNERLGERVQRQHEQSGLIEAGAASLHAVLDALPDAVFGLDPEGLLAFVNRSGAALLPDSATCLGGAPDAVLARLIAAVRAAPEAGSATGIAVELNHGLHRASLRSMRATGAACANERGELLVLTPVVMRAGADPASDGAASEHA